MSTETERPDWWIYPSADQSGSDHNRSSALEKLPKPPPWRRFDLDDRDSERGSRFVPTFKAKQLVNTALYLRRPLLVTGKPGVGKTSLAYAVAVDLGLVPVLRWSISTATRLRDGLYSYDPIARLQDASLEQVRRRTESSDPNTPIEPPPIGDYLRLNALGTAFATSTPERPRVLLIDELDKSDIDLPNDLLHIFEEGEFTIPELQRLRDSGEVWVLPSDAPPDTLLHEDAKKPREDRVAVPITRGRVPCAGFPLVIMTSNGERDFPAAFLRRCLRLDLEVPDGDALIRIVEAHLFGWWANEQKITPDDNLKKDIDRRIQDFLARRERTDLASDQLLQSICMLLWKIDPEKQYLDYPDKRPDHGGDCQRLIDALLRPLSD